MFRKVLLLSILSIFLFSGLVNAETNDLPEPGMLPDSPFYFLKSFFEEIGVFLTFNQTNKTERLLRLAETRLAEANVLAEKGKSELAEKSIHRHQERINQALDRVEQAKAKGMNVDDVLTRVSEATNRHQEVLMRVYEKVPEQAKPAIERAMEQSMQGQEKALEAISQEKREEVMEQMEQKRQEIRERVQNLRQQRPVPPVFDQDDEQEQESEDLEETEE